MSSIFIRLFQRHALRKIINHRKREYISLEKANLIGFVFDVHEDGIHDAIKLLENKLHDSKIAFQGVAIDLGEEQTGNPAFQSDPNIINLYKSDMDWRIIPSHNLLDKFFQKHYDIFFDITLDGIFTTDYIFRMADTSLAIGFSKKREEHYDILITSPQPQGLSEYIDKSLEYLTTIK